MSLTTDTDPSSDKYNAAMHSAIDRQGIFNLNSAPGDPETPVMCPAQQNRCDDVELTNTHIRRRRLRSKPKCDR